MEDEEEKEGYLPPARDTASWNIYKKAWGIKPKLTKESDNTRVQKNMVGLAGKGSPAKVIDQNGKPIKPDDPRYGLAHTAQYGQRRNDVIKAPEKRSLREKIQVGVNNINGFSLAPGGTGNDLTPALLAPVSSAMKLLRPDKSYGGIFDSVESFKEKGTELGFDALAVAPTIPVLRQLAGKSVRKLSPIVEENIPKVGNWAVDKARPYLNQEVGKGKNILGLTLDDIDKLPESQRASMLSNMQSGRTRGDVLLDGIKHSSVYKVGSEVLNKGGLREMRGRLLDKANKFEAPLSAKSLDEFASMPHKRLMQTEDMVVTKGGVHGQLSKDYQASKFGDGKLLDHLKRRLKQHEKPVESTIMLDKGAGTETGHVFSAKVDIPNREITSYSMHMDPDAGGSFRIGKIANKLIKDGPEGYIYEPGSLSGDSYAMWHKILQRHRKSLTPTNSEHINFGEVRELNNLGLDNRLSDNVRKWHQGTGDPKLAAAAQQDIRSVARRTFDSFGVGVEGENLLLQLDGVQFPVMPVRKVTGMGGEVPASVNSSMSREANRLQMVRENALNRPAGSGRINLNRPETVVDDGFTDYTVVDDGPLMNPDPRATRLSGGAPVRLPGSQRPKQSFLNRLLK